jgi:hypothetical protein
MKKIVNPLLVLLFAFNAIACSNAQSNNNSSSDDSTVKTKKVEVYYFHGTRRCVTCIAVGEVSSELIKRVSGSGLHVYNGEDIEDITAFAFQYARTNPDKLKDKLIELINKDL